MKYSEQGKQPFLVIFDGECIGTMTLFVRCEYSLLVSINGNGRLTFFFLFFATQDMLQRSKTI